MNTISQGVPSLWLIRQIAGLGAADRTLARMYGYRLDTITCGSEVDLELPLSKVMVMGTSISGVSPRLMVNRSRSERMKTC